MAKKFIIIPVIAGVVFVLLATSALAFASYKDWVNIPFLKNTVERVVKSDGENSGGGILDKILPSKEPTLDSIIENNKKAESAKLTVSIDADIEEREGSTPVFPIDDTKIEADSGVNSFSGSDLDEVLPFVSQYNLKADFSTYWKKDSSLLKENEIELTGSVVSSGMTMSVDVAAKILNDNKYFIINAIPMLTSELGEIEGKWIKDDGDYLNSLDSIENIDYKKMYERENKTSSNIPFNYNDNTITNIRSELNMLLEQASNDEAISLEILKDDSSDTEWKTKLTLDKDKLISTYKNINNDKHELLSDIEEYLIFNDQAANHVMTDLFIKQLHALNEGVTLYLYVDKKEGYLTKVETITEIGVAERGRVQDQQLDLYLSFTFSDINQEINIEEPTEYIGLLEAFLAMDDISMEEYNFYKQKSGIREIRTVLEKYYDNEGKYPQTLDELIGYKYPTYKDSTYNYVVTYVPEDVFTGEPFIYKAAADNYSLKYTMQFYEDMGTYDSKDYIEGVNTADKGNVSLEGAENKDTDGDGLLDIEENNLGTSIYKKDTDGDGYDDKTEVDGGFDPLTKPEGSTKTPVTADIIPSDYSSIEL